jgi:hypothetical protein
LITPAISAVWFVASTSARPTPTYIQSVARTSRPWIAAYRGETSR